MKNLKFTLLVAAVTGISAFWVPTLASAEEIFLGFDTQSPVQQYTTAGAFLSNFGQSGATGSALDGSGHAWTVAPNFGNNNIQKYDAAQSVLNTFTATISGQWVEDMAYGGFVGGVETLWLSTYEGSVFRVNANTGAVISSFAPGLGQFLGVAYDGTDLWLTGGAFQGNTNISRYSTTGTLLSAINTGTTGAGGIGYSLDANTLWVGYYGTVKQYSLSGALLSSFTAGTAFHDGLEIGNFQQQQVPEPASLALLGIGLAGLGAIRRKQRT